MNFATSVSPCAPVDGANSSWNIYSPIRKIGSNSLKVEKYSFGCERVVIDESERHVLIYRISGATAVGRTCEGATIIKRPRPGTCTLAPAGTPSVWDMAGDTDVIHIRIHQQAVAGFVDEHPEYRNRGQLCPFFGEDDPWLSHYFRIFMLEMEYGGAQENLNSFYLSQTEHLIVRHLLRRQCLQANKLDPAVKYRVSPLRSSLVGRVNDFIEAHMAQEILVSDLAKLVHMSPDHFLRALSSAIGQTPQRYLLQRRLERAASLLRDDTLPLAEIARVTGFKTAAHFSTRFKAAYGMQPRAYRNGVAT